MEGVIIKIKEKPFVLSGRDLAYNDGVKIPVHVKDMPNERIKVLEKIGKCYLGNIYQINMEEIDPQLLKIGMEKAQIIDTDKINWINGGHNLFH